MRGKKGRELSVRIVEGFEEAEEADEEFWASMTPEERVAAVDDCVRDYLRMRGERQSRLRRVFRRAKCPWSSKKDK